MEKRYLERHPEKTIQLIYEDAMVARQWIIFLSTNRYEVNRMMAADVLCEKIKHQKNSPLMKMIKKRPHFRGGRKHKSVMKKLLSVVLLAHENKISYGNAAEQLNVYLSGTRYRILRRLAKKMGLDWRELSHKRTRKRKVAE